MSKKIKFIIYSFIVLLIVVVGASVSFGERIKFTDLPLRLQAGILNILGLNPVQPGEESQMYELLIKKSPTGVGEGAYQAGDIVMAKSVGYEWSSGEMANFWIVSMMLTPSQAEALVQSDDSHRRKFYLEPNDLQNIEIKQTISREAVKER